MKVPFPNISSDLAVNAHMYICSKSNHPNYGFVKCQTLKPYMVGSTIFTHFIDEYADKNRNPFNNPTRIDCDKLFTSKSCYYDDKLKTPSRPDVCAELYNELLKELNSDGYKTIQMKENELISINKYITTIRKGKNK